MTEQFNTISMDGLRSSHSIRAREFSLKVIEENEILVYNIIGR